MGGILGGLGSLAGGIQNYITGTLAAPFTVWSILDNPPPGVPATQNGPWRPPNWGVQPQFYMLTASVPNQSVQGGVQSTNYFFDAIPTAEHDQRYTPTKHPVQTGAAISDHVYREPAVVVLQINVSDVLDSFVSGQYSSNASKSISVYQTLKYIASLKTPITLTTRLDTYKNMLITDIRVSDTRDTQFGLRAWVTFSEIIPASISTTTINVLNLAILSQPLSSSPRIDVGDPVFVGTSTPSSPSSALTDGFEVPSILPAPVGSASTNGYPFVPGAGDWSSIAVGGGIPLVD
jgi:hypothetical protein